MHQHDPVLGWCRIDVEINRWKVCVVIQSDVDELDHDISAAAGRKLGHLEEIASAAKIGRDRRCDHARPGSADLLELRRMVAVGRKRRSYKRREDLKGWISARKTG